MANTWYTEEVIRCLITDADLDDLRELLEETGDEAAEALKQWVQTGNAPKSLYDALLRFSDGGGKALQIVDWDRVVVEVLQQSAY